MEQTKNRPTGRTMGLERYGLNVLWDGMTGMRWLSIVSVVLCMMKCFGLPKAIVIPCCENAICCVSTGCLNFHLQLALFMINKMFPCSNIIFPQIFYLERNDVIPPITGQWKIFANV